MESRRSGRSLPRILASAGTLLLAASAGFYATNAAAQESSGAAAAKKSDGTQPVLNARRYPGKLTVKGAINAETVAKAIGGVPILSSRDAANPNAYRVLTSNGVVVVGRSQIVPPTDDTMKERSILVRNQPLRKERSQLPTAQTPRTKPAIVKPLPAPSVVPQTPVSTPSLGTLDLEPAKRNRQKTAEDELPSLNLGPAPGDPLATPDDKEPMPPTPPSILVPVPLTDPPEPKSASDALSPRNLDTPLPPLPRRPMATPATPPVNGPETLDSTTPVLGLNRNSVAPANVLQPVAITQPDRGDEESCLLRPGSELFERFVENERELASLQTKLEMMEEVFDAKAEAIEARHEGEREAMRARIEAMEEMRDRQEAAIEALEDDRREI
ncbi:MAG: hypothetical protein AAFP90_16925, partial [Planctomycetota bacterium]